VGAAVSDGGETARPGRVLVIGASSQVGQFAIPRLRARGFTIHALSRHGRPAHYPVLDGVEWVDPERSRRALADYAWLLSAGPLALAMDYANAMTALQGIAVTSSSSVLSKADSPDPNEQMQVEVLRQAEEGLRSLARNRRLPLLILRPTLVYGCGLDRNLTRLAGWIRRFGIVPVSSRAGGLRQPIHADDVAQALVAGLAPRDQRELVSPLCGGDTLDYRSMVRRVFSALDRKPRLLTLPPGVLAGLLKAFSAVSRGSEVGPEMVYRQSRNLVFDDAEARRILQIEPRRFHPGPAAFALPEARLIERLAAGQ
jgi:nucleoside-diphosphate-sugar epimerase